MVQNSTKKKENVQFRCSEFVYILKMLESKNKRAIKKVEFQAKGHLLEGLWWFSSSAPSLTLVSQGLCGDQLGTLRP